VAVEVVMELESQNYQQLSAMHLGTMAALWEDLHSLHLVTTIKKT